MDKRACDYCGIAAGSLYMTSAGKEGCDKCTWFFPLDPVHNALIDPATLDGSFTSDTLAEFVRVIMGRNGLRRGRASACAGVRRQDCCVCPAVAGHAEGCGESAERFCG